MAYPNMTDVTEEAFRAFVKNYPRRLERDVYGACEPPLITYNDFELAPAWPESIVASTNTERTFYRIASALVKAPPPTTPQPPTPQEQG